MKNNTPSPMNFDDITLDAGPAQACFFVPGSATVPTASMQKPNACPAPPTPNHVLGETPRTAGGTPALPGTKSVHPKIQK
jgi:hypothetical protein